MASNYDLKVLREQIANDTIVINAKKERLKKLQQQRSKDPNDFYRNEVINWSRASVTAYSTKLEQLEQKHKPTVEEKEVLQALNTPILLGDQLTDMQLKLQEQFEARFGKLPTGNMPWEAEVPDGDRKNVPRWQTPAAKTRSGSTSTIAAAKEASSAAGQARSATVEDDDNEETQPSGAESTQDHAADNDSDTNAVGPDQKGIYAALGLAPNAAMSDVKKYEPAVLIKRYQQC